MAKVKAFRGLRYNQEEIKKISNVIAPPYDVINSEQQKELMNSSQYNVVHIDFNDGEGGEKYNISINTLNHWIENNILALDDKESLYPYLQEFEYKGKGYKKIGLIGLVKIHEFKDKIILPHEETFSGPKEDRLKLLRACKTNLSPIFGVYDNNDKKIDNIINEFLKSNQPIVEARSTDGILNKIWQISDSEIINKIEENFNDKEILIADGHHRYETSLNYMNEVKTKESEYAMFYLSGTNQDGLLINPTHRILQNVNGIKDIIKSISDSFIISEYSDEIIEDKLRPNEFFIISESEKVKLLCQIKGSDEKRFYSMSVYAVQDLIIDKFKNNYDELDFFKSLEDAKSSISENSLGIILPKFVPDDIMKVVLNDDKMPQKSTYFYPKVATGVLFNRLY